MSTTIKPLECFYCNKPVEKPVIKTIYDRVRDDFTRKQRVRERSLIFCSPECATHCQCSLEG